MSVDSGYVGLQPEVEEKANILLVDDLPEKLLVFETLLEELGQNVTSVRSGNEALREVLKQEFAVILLDVNMPDIDGFETASLIRKYKRSAHTPIIFITAYADEMQTARGYSLGAVDYILSPVVPSVLRSKVKVFVELHIMQRRMRRQADERIALAASEAARHLAEENTRRSTFLSQASRVLSGSLDVGIGMRKLLELVVPELAQSATLVLLDEQQHARRALTCEPDARGTLSTLQRSFDDLPPAEQAAFARSFESRAREPAPAEDASVAGAPATPAGSVVPLLIGERSLGALLVRNHHDAEETATLDELASRAAIAFENARLYRSLQIEIDERSQAETRLQESNQRKDEFLAMLSHELRNPLAPIRNAVQVFRLRSPSDPKLIWATDVTDRQVKHLTRLVDELLDVARISQGKIVLQMESIDLLRVIDHSVETVRPLIEERRHTLTQELPASPVWLRGDAARLSQVLGNLLNNAAKYTDPGGHIHLSLAVSEGQAVLSIQDDGLGIEPEVLPNVFDLFEQGRRSLDRSQGGLGVGLTLVQRLVQMHNGRVEVASAGPGKGAEFRVILPCISEVRLPDEPAALPDAATFGGCRVLVVDDNRDAAESTALFLEMAGHEVQWVDDAFQALTTAAAFAPHVVVLDIGLPSMDGFEVARRLRKLPETAGAMLIALTGYGQQGDRLQGVEAGFDEHLVKPADPELLVKLVGDWYAAAMHGAERQSHESG